jgi:hypothetical protein
MSDQAKNAQTEVVHLHAAVQLSDTDIQEIHEGLLKPSEEAIRALTREVAEKRGIKLNF